MIGAVVVLVQVPEMDQIGLIQGPIVKNFELNVGNDAVGAGYIRTIFTAVLIFNSVTIVVTDNMIIIIIIIIICVHFGEKDIKGRRWKL